MYHKVLAKEIRVAAIVAMSAIGVVLAASLAEAQGDPLKCQRALVKEGAKLDRKRAKALQKCNDARIKGGDPLATCPDADSTSKINDAQAKMLGKIGDACTGVTALSDTGFNGLVNRCVGGTADGEPCTTPSDCNMGACTAVDRCPSLFNGGLAVGPDCDFPIAMPITAAPNDDPADCVRCIGQQAVEVAILATYAQLALPIPAPEPEPGDVLKCQRTLGKETFKYYGKVRKIFSKCEDGVLKGDPGPCPDADSSTKIGEALGKFNAKVSSSCPTGTWPNGGNLAQALANQPLCPTVGIGAATGFSSTLQCLTDTLAECSSLAATADTTGCQPLCGNGSIDAGEDCDDGNYVNGDGCPNDCTLVNCTTDGTQVTANINVTVPAHYMGANVLQVYIEYPEDKIKIPGTGNAQLVFDNYFATDAGAGIDLNDLNYGIYILENGAGVTNIAGLPSFGQIEFDHCDLAAAPADTDFDCIVLDASNAGGTVAGATCTVDVP
jgi:cysteine-rich repeat protein